MLHITNISPLPEASCVRLPGAPWCLGVGLPCCHSAVPFGVGVVSLWPHVPAQVGLLVRSSAWGQAEGQALPSALGQEAGPWGDGP